MPIAVPTAGRTKARTAPRLSITVAVTLLLCVAGSLRADYRADYEVRTDARVVAFGDVHGAFGAWTALLRELKVIDAKLDWIGGDTHLVSLGDLVDRGPGSRQVVELLKKLDTQAERAGGAVHMVLGNHEVMLLTGDLRYVTAAEYAAFAPDESAAEREVLYAEYRRFHPEGDEAAVRAAFDEQYPAGFLALRKAYSPEGELGRWLLEQPFVIKVNDKVYMHAGIASDISEKSIDEINLSLHAELRDFLSSMAALRRAGVMPWFVGYQDRLTFLNARAEEFAAANPGVMADWFEPVKQVFDAQQAFVFSDDSVNWYRGTAVCHPYAESFNTERFLKRVGARQLVVGHTPTSGDVLSRMDGLVIRLDTGMLASVYNGRPAALVSERGDDYVHYPGQSERAQPTPEVRSLAQQLSRMTDGELERFMRTAPVVSVEKIGTGVTRPKRVTQALDGVSNDAIFKYEDTQPGLQNFDTYSPRRYDDADRYRYDVAAYRLDRLLDLQMVPTATLATIEGDEGALSDWAGNTINERDRVEQDLPFTGYCKQFEQYRLRFVFDILIYNEDRNLTNLLWDRDDYRLMFIDHSLAFRSTKARPGQYSKVELQVSDLFRERLLGLNREQLTGALSDYLHPRQIEALLARRDLILKEAVGTSP